MIISSPSKIKELTNRLNELKETNKFIGDVSNLYKAIELVDWKDVPENSKSLAVRQVFKKEVNKDDYLPSEAEQIMAWLNGKPWTEEDDKDHQLSLLQSASS